MVLTATTGLILAYGPPAVKLRYTLYPATTDVLGFQRRLTVCDSVAVPDPDRVSTTGVLAALLASEILPDAAPLLWGVKVSETGALCPAARVLGRDNPTRRNSELVEVADVMVTLEPVAVSVAVKVLLVPTVTPPKSNTPALDVNRPPETPVPERATARFGFDASETTAMAPLTAPPTFGLKRTLKVMLCPPFRLKGKVRPLKLKPAPVTVAWEMVSVE